MKGNTEWDEERREENGKSKKIYRKERDGKQMNKNRKSNMKLKGIIYKWYNMDAGKKKTRSHWKGEDDQKGKGVEVKHKERCIKETRRIWVRKAKSCKPDGRHRVTVWEWNRRGVKVCSLPAQHASMIKTSLFPPILKQCWGTTFSMKTCFQCSVFSGLSSHTTHTLTEHMCQQEAFSIHVIIMMNPFNHQFSLDVSMKIHQLHAECKWRLTCYNVITSKSSRVYL